MQVLKDEIRKHILQAAEDLFYEVGFEGTTTRNIAAEVGISVSNLYLYYENKEAIFSAVIEPFYEYHSTRMAELLRTGNSGEAIKDKLSRLVKDFIGRDRRKFIILTDRSHGTKYEYARIGTIQELKKHFCSLLSDTIQDKELISYIIANNLVSGIVEIAKNYQDERQMEDSLKYLITYHTNGLRSLLN